MEVGSADPTGDQDGPGQAGPQEQRYYKPR